MVHFHHVTTQDVVEHLGMICEFEMRDGSFVSGRVVAADHENVHLTRTTHGTVRLDAIKQVVTPSPTGRI